MDVGSCRSSPSRLCASRTKGGIQYIYRPTDNGRYIRAFPQPSPRRRMSLTSSFNSSQPHRYDGPSSEFHDQLDDLHDGEEVSTPSTSHEALPDIADRGCLELLYSPAPAIHADVGHPGWERLIRSSLAIHERVTLITAIFSNRDEVGMLRHLCRDDAQVFIDVIYEVRSFFHLRGGGGSVDFSSNLCGFSIRR